MFSLKGRQDNFKLIIPDDFIANEINEKYTNILKRQKSFLYRPIDFLNETIQSIEILGFNNAIIPQQQTSHGKPLINPKRIEENRFAHTLS